MVNKPHGEATPALSVIKRNFGAGETVHCCIVKSRNASQELNAKRFTIPLAICAIAFFGREGLRVALLADAVINDDRLASIRAYGRGTMFLEAASPYPRRIGMKVRRTRCGEYHGKHTP